MTSWCLCSPGFEVRYVLPRRREPISCRCHLEPTGDGFLRWRYALPPAPRGHTEDHPGQRSSPLVPFGPQMTREHRRRHPQPVRADVEGLLEQEIARSPPIVSGEQAAVKPAEIGRAACRERGCTDV